MFGRTMTIDTLHDKFVYELQQVYYIETELVDVLATLEESTADDRISEEFQKHQRTSADHARRLKRAFDVLDEEAEPRQSHAFDGIIEDRQTFLAEVAEDTDLVDLYNVGAAMKIERLEITTYEGLLTHADELDLPNEATEPLDNNLDDEKDTLRELEGITSGSTIQQLLGRLTG